MLLTVHDDGNPLAMLGGEDVVQQRRLASSKVPCNPPQSDQNPIARRIQIDSNEHRPVTIVRGTFTGFSSGSGSTPVLTSSGGPSWSSQSISNEGQLDHCKQH